MDLTEASRAGIFPSKKEIDFSSLKRKKLSSEERLVRSRERNRIHARKTRERKKQQMNALQKRMEDLNQEGLRLRQLVDERYTASVLLGLSDTYCNGYEVALKSSPMLCGNSYDRALSDKDWLRDQSSQPSQKRVRRRGKYSPQEREKIRRERNRMHAKRTRDRKKIFFEASEQVILDMETETKTLRDYLVSINAISQEEADEYNERDNQSRRELALLKASQFEFDQSYGSCSDEDEFENDKLQHLNDPDDDGDDEDNAENDGSMSGDDDSDGRHENESNQGSNNGSWNGSNEGSLNGETSGESTESRNGSDSGGSNDGNKTNERSNAILKSNFNNSATDSTLLSVGSEIGSRSGNGSPNHDGSKSEDGDDGENDSPNESGEALGENDDEVEGSSYASLKTYPPDIPWQSFGSKPKESSPQFWLNRCTVSTSPKESALSKQTKASTEYSQSLDKFNQQSWL